MLIQNIPAGATAIGVPAEFVIPQKSSSDKNAIIDSSIQATSMDWAGDEQEKIINLWKELLNIDSINLDDNFFDIGGSSVLAVQLYEKLNNQIASKLNLIDVFHYPTVNLLTNFIKQKKYVFTEFNKTPNSKRVEIFRQRFSIHNLDDENLDYDAENTREIRE